MILAYVYSCESEFYWLHFARLRRIVANSTQHFTLNQRRGLYTVTNTPGQAQEGGRTDFSGTRSRIWCRRGGPPYGRPLRQVGSHAKTAQLQRMCLFRPAFPPMYRQTGCARQLNLTSGRSAGVFPVRHSRGSVGKILAFRTLIFVQLYCCFR